MAGGNNLCAQAKDHVKYVLDTTFKSFGVSWDRYEEDFEDLLERHKGRVMKYSVNEINDQCDGDSPLATALRALLESFVETSILPKILSISNSEKFLLLTIHIISYLRKSTDWFQDIFSDFDTVAWPYDETCSYSEGCRRFLSRSVFAGLRNKIKEHYFRENGWVRKRYQSGNLPVYQSFYEERIVPLFAFVSEWERKDGISFWWAPMTKEIDNVFKKRVESATTVVPEASFVMLLSTVRKGELLLLKKLPDDDEHSNYNRIKHKMAEAMCKVFWEKSTFSFLGIVKKETTFDAFIFKKLLEMHMSSPKHGDKFVMHLRSAIRKEVEEMVLTLVDVDSIEKPTLEDLKPLLTELEECTTRVLERLEPHFDEYPCLKIFKKELSRNIRTSLSIYRIDGLLVHTEGAIADGLKEPTVLDSTFWEEAKFMALFIKYLAVRPEIMTDFEYFATLRIREGNQHEVKTLAAFVSRHRSVCTTLLYNTIAQANLFENSDE